MSAFASSAKLLHWHMRQRFQNVRQAKKRKALFNSENFRNWAYLIFHLDYFWYKLYLTIRKLCLVILSIHWCRSLLLLLWAIVVVPPGGINLYQLSKSSHQKLQCSWTNWLDCRTWIFGQPCSLCSIQEDKADWQQNQTSQHSVADLHQYMYI